MQLLSTLAGSGMARTIIADMAVLFTADTTALERGFREVDGKLAGAQTRAGKMAAAMGSVGSTLTRKLTLPVAAAGFAAGKLYLDFDKSMTNIKAMVGASEQDLALYRKGIMKLAGETARSPKELAEALYFVTSSGFEGAGALRVLESSALAAKAGMGDTMVVADALTSAVNAYGEQALSASRATDIMVKAVKVGKMEPEELAANIGDVVTAAKVMGVEFDEVAGSLAAMSLTGISTPEAVTALNSFLSGLTHGSDKGAKALEAMGLSYEQLRQIVRDKGVITAMRTLYERVGGDMEAMSAIVPNVRARKALFALMELEGEKLDNVMREVTESTGATSEAAKKAEDDGYRLKEAWSKLQAAGIELGSYLVPIFTRFVEFGTKLLKAFERLPGPVKKFLTYALTAGAAVGPLLVGISKVTTAWRTLRGIDAGSKLLRTLRDIPPLSGRASGALVDLGDRGARGLMPAVTKAGRLRSILTFIGKAGLVAGALAATSYAVYEAIGAWKQYRDAVKQASEAYEGAKSTLAQQTARIAAKYGTDSPQYKKWMKFAKKKGAAIEADKYEAPWWDVTSWFGDGGKAAREAEKRYRSKSDDRTPLSSRRIMHTQDVLARQKTITKNYLILGNREIELVTKEVARTAKRLGRR